MTESATQKPQPHDEHRTGRRRFDNTGRYVPGDMAGFELAGLLMKGTVRRDGTVVLIPKSEPRR